MISVIIPFYNVEKYLPATLESLAKQDYQNIEFILIDDGSNDNSGQICDKFCRNKKNFIVCHKNNGGVSSARNYGLTIAKGDYISFVDGDDLIQQNYFSTLVDEALKDECDIVQSDFVRNDDNDSRIIGLNNSLIVGGGIEACKLLFEPNKILLNSVCGKLFKKEIIFGIKFDENLSVGEDLKFSFQAILNAKKIKVLEYAGYRYSIREGSAMESSFNLKRFNDFSINDWIVKTYLIDEEFKKRIRTRDAKNAVECYYLIVCETKLKKEKEFVIKRLKEAKDRYPLGKKYEFVIWFIIKASWLIDPFLKMYYRKKQKNRHKA